MSAVLFVCVWCRMGLSWSSEESRLDVRITGGSFPSQGPEFCAMQFVRTCLGPKQPSLWYVQGDLFLGFSGRRGHLTTRTGLVSRLRTRRCSGVDKASADPGARCPPTKDIEY